MKALKCLYKPLRNILMSALFFIMFPNTLLAETSLWEISKGNRTLYLGGTIHMLKKEDYPLPSEYNKAFAMADKLVVETNIDATQTPAFGKKMTRLLSYDSNKTLKLALDNATFSQLSQYVSARGLFIESFMTFKPVMVVLTLSMMELARIGMTGMGVDEHFYRKAQSVNKPLAYFETAEQQLNFIVNMGAGNDNKLIQQTLAEISQMESIIQKMKSAWRTGNESKLAETTIVDMMRDYPELYQTILVQRNNNWMPTIENMLRDKGIELILVGALHLVGEDGLLQQLRLKGYQVKHFH